MEIQVVSFQKHKRLSVLQFICNPQNTLDYISGLAAIKNNLIHVKEVSVSGNVNSLYLFNNSDQYVFFMDGDILTGAKQNRVLNTSVFIAPDSKMTLPVSCIEKGRWSAVSDKFNSADFISPQKLRAKKSRAVKENLRAGSKFMAEQSEVWKDVDSYSTSFKIKSPTNSLTDIFEKKKDDFETFVKKFPLNRDANGIVIFTDNQMLNVDLFNRTDVYCEYYPKILRSTAMEVIHLENKENLITEAEAGYKTADLFDSLEKMEYSLHPGVAAGEEKRYDNENLTGFQLIYKNKIVHLTLLNL